jgi:hypothetical protein
VFTASPAAAQFWGDPFARPRPPRGVPQQQNPFGGFFQPQPTPFWQPMRPRPARPALGDFSKAPPPKKPDTPPVTNILVLGDAMADWLGYGLEEAYADNPEFGVARKIRPNTGLIRNESRTDSHDWVQYAREQLASEKPDFVVMIIGLSDRVAIRERATPRPARPGQPGQPNQPEKPGQQGQAAQQPQQAPQGQQPNQQAQQGQAKEAAPPSEEAQAKPEQPEQPAAALATAPAPVAGATHEFRSERWGELYAKRIDDTIAVLKSKGVPVVLVGLPPIRGTRSRSDLTYLNDLYRSRAQKAGITYVDVWDGFVDEDGNFSLRGPDYNGQIRQLRSADGTYFTKAGALKLAHYVEREIQRLMQARATPVALPAPEPQPQTPATPGAPAARPVAGPVIPLTAVTAAPEDLVGTGPGRGASSATSDPTAARVLVRGEPPAAPSGRADDFSWPRPEVDNASIIPAAVVPNAAPAPQRPGKKGSAPAAQKDKGKEKAAPKRGGGGQAAANPPAQTRQSR